MRSSVVVSRAYTDGAGRKENTGRRTMRSTRARLLACCLSSRLLACCLSSS
jgi:hypothetical protein